MLSGGAGRIGPSGDAGTKSKQLLEAATDGNTTEVKRLLAAGASPGTALMHASTKGHTATVQALLDVGADVNAKDKVCPPRCRPAPAAARRRSLTRRARRAAAPPGRMAAPASSRPRRPVDKI